jgi:hypothetical protein
VSIAARLSRLCTPFSGKLNGLTVCLTIWITDARCTVLKMTPLSAGAGIDMAPITVAA